MASRFEEVPRRIWAHIRRVLLASNLPPRTGDPSEQPPAADAAESIAHRWREMESRFETIVARMELEEARTLRKKDSRGCLALTVSGSLVSIGPLRKHGRTVRYASMGIRTDVPQQATHINSRLAVDVVVEEPIRFVAGPVASSSPVFRIALTDEEIDLEEMEHIGRRAARATTRELIEANRELEVGED
jgi:hypothetical protein